MIKAVIFDYGGILGQKQDSHYVEEICRLTGLQREEFETNYRLERPAYDGGEIDGRQYWSSLLQRMGVEPEEQLLEKLIHCDYKSWTRDRIETIDLARRLKKSGYKVAILSNMPFDIGGYIKADKEWLELFSPVLFSSEIKMSKPNEDIYLHCLEKLGVEACEALFIDDTYENIEAAERLGIRGYWFREDDFCLEKLEELCGMVEKTP